PRSDPPSVSYRHRRDRAPRAPRLSTQITASRPARRDYRAVTARLPRILCAVIDAPLRSAYFPLHNTTPTPTLT
ncbi:unnamed protein product, partial [Closterium sp. Naga37s-1]